MNLKYLFIIVYIVTRSAYVFATVWQGEYTDVPHNAYLEVKNCTQDGCDFHYSAGGIDSVCEVSGKFKFKGLEKAELVQEYNESDLIDQCILNLVKKNDDSVFFDANSTGEDNVCNAKCGNRGARDFGYTLKPKKVKSNKAVKVKKMK